jgi:hypothetical protein
VRAVTPGPVLLVVDYAETRAGLGVLLDAAVADAPDADLAAAAVPFFVAALGFRAPDGVVFDLRPRRVPVLVHRAYCRAGQRQRNPSANAGLEG